MRSAAVVAAAAPPEDLNEEVLRRRRSWRRASGLAEWTRESHDWQRKASSAAQYQRARFLMQLSQARAVLPPAALAAAAVVVEILGGVMKVREKSWDFF